MKRLDGKNDPKPQTDSAQMSSVIKRYNIGIAAVFLCFIAALIATFLVKPWDFPEEIVGTPDAVKKTILSAISIVVTVGLFATACLLFIKRNRLDK
jgi:uncharacterized membrane protein YedE/YeeE